MEQCSSQGICLAPNYCYCYDGFEGADCNQTLGENTNAPVLADFNISLSIRENTAAGLSLFVFNATDADSGKNGLLRYSLDYSAAGFDLGEHMIIDSLSGQLSLVRAIPRRMVPSGVFSFTVVVTDQGVPKKRAEAVVQVSVVDINDNCPRFTLPPVGLDISLNTSTPVNTTVVTVTAEDDDYGENGEVTVSLVQNTDQLSDYLKLNGVGDIYTTQSPLPVGKYNIEVAASDGAANPCSTKLSIPVDVYPEGLIKATTPVPATITPATTTVTSVSVSGMTSDRPTSHSDSTSPGSDTTINHPITVLMTDNTLASTSQSESAESTTSTIPGSDTTITLPSLCR